MASVASQVWLNTMAGLAISQIVAITDAHGKLAVTSVSIPVITFRKTTALIVGCTGGRAALKLFFQGIDPFLQNIDFMLQLKVPKPCGITGGGGDEEKKCSEKGRAAGHHDALMVTNNEGMNCESVVLRRTRTHDPINHR
jgi:hypothetical protein